LFRKGEKMDIFMDIASVPVITVLVYWFIEFFKQITNNNENFKRFLPILATIIGIILGLVIYFTLPNMAIAENVLYAILVGGVSGLGATGTNQIIKQLSKYFTHEITENEEQEKTSSSK
jgi:hypothetical protein